MRRVEVSGQELSQMTLSEKVRLFSEAGFTMAKPPQLGARCWVSIDTGISPDVHVRIEQHDDGRMTFEQLDS